MSPRPDVSEERKSQILQAATAVFARLGFHQARMDDIAQQAGLSKATLYLYFESKEAIITALLKIFFDQELYKLRDWMASEHPGSISEQIMDITEQLVEDVAWISSVISIAHEFYALAARREDVREFLRAHYREYRFLFARLIQQGIERGEFRQVDPESVAISLMALYEGLSLLGLIDAQAMQLARTSENTMRLLLAGLAKEKA
ncbi:TetR/AcrR family transcriptional regulator [Ktedonosporobacter rubrisoli]|nr:TetR/AcrR family transcriptional regulator [Ktedonosporobacter rubrisoli]